MGCRGDSRYGRVQAGSSGRSEDLKAQPTHQASFPMGDDEPPGPEPITTPEIPVEPIPTPYPPDYPDPERPRRRRRRRDRQQEDPIREYGTTAIPQDPNRIHTLTIIGQIEGHLTLPSQNKTTKYEHMIPQLVGVEQSPQVEGLLVILNTVGGDVEAGLAIAEMIKSLSKPSVSIVLGGGHSIGVPVAPNVTTESGWDLGKAS